MSDKTKAAKSKAIELKLAELLEYYASISGGRFPDQIAEDRKSYGGIVLRWLEPLVPNATNVMLVEEALGDSWTLRFQSIQPAIKVFTP